MRALPRAFAALALAAAATASVFAPVAPPGPFVPRERSRVRRLTPAQIGAAASPANPLAALDLARALDGTRRAGPVSIGGRVYDVGLASDAEFKYFYAAFSRGGRTTLVPISRPRDLRHGGVVLPIEGRAYRVTLDLNLAAPVHGSVLQLSPADGKPGADPQWTTGELLELLGRKAAYFRLSGEEFFLAYVSDMDPATARPAGTRSFLFFRDGRFRPRAWALREADLPDGARAAVQLGERRVLLERRRGLLVVYSL